jgi:hypothetical protein
LSTARHQYAVPGKISRKTGQSVMVLPCQRRLGLIGKERKDVTHMFYMLLVVAAIAVFALAPPETSISMVIVLGIHTLVTMAAAYFVIGKVSMMSALKAVVFSVLLTFAAVVLVLPSMSHMGPWAPIIALLFIYGAIAWGISLALESSLGQSAIKVFLIMVINVVIDKVFNLGLGFSGLA